MLSRSDVLEEATDGGPSWCHCEEADATHATSIRQHQWVSWHVVCAAPGEASPPRWSAYGAYGPLPWTAAHL